MKNVLLIGLHPRHVDFTDMPSMDEGALSAALNAEEARLNSLGYRAAWCLIDTGETAETAILERLRAERFDCILVGAGVRTLPVHFLLFERIINLLHMHAPQARLCFNTKPSDSAEAIQRRVLH